MNRSDSNEGKGDDWYSLSRSDKKKVVGIRGIISRLPEGSLIHFSHDPIVSLRDITSDGSSDSMMVRVLF